MYEIDWLWRPLVDREVSRVFVISPLFGTLLSISNQRCKGDRLPFTTKLLGCTTGTRSDVAWSVESITPPFDHRSDYQPDSRHETWSRNIRSELEWWPLAWIINRIERQSLRKPSAVDAERNLIDGMLGAWTYSLQPECLPRALFRYGWLRSRGVPCELVVGAHVPTDRMHAWIELDGSVIGEEPDEMLCFQGAVRYFPKRGRR